jgi:hypothetical protein
LDWALGEKRGPDEQSDIRGFISTDPAYRGTCHRAARSLSPAARCADPQR